MADSAFMDAVAKAIAETPDHEESTTVQVPAHKSLLEKMGTPAFMLGAGLDWTSTADVHNRGGFVEQNPAVNFVHNEPAMIALGAGEDLAGYLIAKKLLKNHPKLFNAGLLAAGGLRAGLAGRNWERLANYEKQKK